MNLQEIMPALAAPFLPTAIGFKPKPKNHFKRDGKTMCLALPFADTRVYEDRLNQVCPGEWSSQAQIIVADDKLVCVVTLTVCGVPHTDVGEAKLSNENAATSAKAQAFKRACSQVGLGRFLYAFPKQYLPWEGTEQRGHFAVTAKERFDQVKEMYRQAGLLSSVPTRSRQEPNRQQPPAPAGDSPATAEQIATIRQLAVKAHRYVRLPRTFADAEKLLAEFRAAG